MYSHGEAGDWPEKRQFPRIEASLTVDMRTKYIFTTAYVLNLSNNGLFIMSKNPLPEGSEIEIITHLPDEKKPFHFKGIVRWTRMSASGTTPSGMGIQLINPKVTHIKKLIRAIKKSPKAL